MKNKLIKVDNQYTWKNNYNKALYIYLTLKKYIFIIINVIT